MSYIICYSLMLVVSYSYADDYVAPPPGPYQSSVVIHQYDRTVNESLESQQQKVYKFPAADLFEPVVEPGTQNRNPDNQFFNDLAFPSESSLYRSQVDDQTSEVPAQLMPGIENQQSGTSVPDNPYTAPFQYGNPWATNQSRSITNYSDGWGRNQYPGNYPNHYGYNNPSNMMNNTNSFMPSPWSMMPMQPFSSGR